MASTLRLKNLNIVTIESAKMSRVEPATNLKPKEHGAYAILGIPIVTSCCITGPTWVGLSVAIGSVTGFLAHEPLLVVLGHRGSRAQRSTTSAQRALAVLLTVTIAGGVVAMVMGSTNVRYSLLACGGLAIASFVLAVAGKHRTLGGQLWGVVGLSIPCVPILLAGDVPTLLTIEAWVTWLIGFGSTTMAVRGVIAAQKRQSRALPWAVIVTLSIAVVGLTVTGFSIPIATLPMVAMSWYLLYDPPRARQIKRVGWTLVGGTVASAIWMLIII